MNDKHIGLSSVTLLILGDNLDPNEVTRRLAIFPDQAWRVGDFPEIQTPSGRWIQSTSAALFGGWKKYMPKILEGEMLGIQLLHWSEALESKADIIRALRDRGWSVILDCFVTASEPEMVELTAELLAKLAAIGSDVDFHFYPHSET